jgi:Fe(3+) dicitrate transport protein
MIITLLGLALAAEPAVEDPAAEAPATEPATEAPAAEEDDPTLEVIIESDGRVPRAAGSAHTIDAATLERDEHDDIHRVLAGVPGVYVRGEDGFGLRPNIGMRGANSDRSAKVTLMEDGVLLAPAPYAAPAAYYFPMTTRLVGLEVFKGPAATRFGPQTVGGALNLLTRPAPTAPTGALDVAVGLREAVKLHGFAGAGGERWGLLLEGVHLSSGGFKQLDGGGPTGFDRQELMGKLRLSDAVGETGHAVELKVGFGRERSNETYLGLTQADFEATPYRRYAASAEDLMRWERSQVELSWRAEGPGFDVRTVAYHHYLTRQWTKLNSFAGGPSLHDLLLAPDAGQAAVFTAILRGEEDSATSDQTLQIGTNDRRYHSFGLQSVARWRTSTAKVASQLELGLRVHGDVVDRLHTEDPFLMRSGALVPEGGPTATTLDAHTGALALAAHVHEDLGIGPLRLLPGLRAEVIRTTAELDGVVSEPVTRAILLPGLGVHGTVTPWLDLFAGAHRGFSPVAPGEPVETRPESAWSYELGARAGRGGQVDVVGFFSDYDNLTGQCTLSGGCAESQLDRQLNGGRAFVWGLEALLRDAWALPQQLELSGELSYTWTGSRFRAGFVSEFPQFGTVEAGDHLPYLPEHQGAARLTLSHPRVSLTVGGNLRGPMRDVAGQGPIADEARIPTAFLLDMAAHVHITRLVEGYLTVTNLGNTAVLESFRPFGARPAAPVQGMIGVKVGG